MIIVLTLLGICGGLTNAQDYLGCYKDSSGESDAVATLNHASAPTECISECKSRSYMYAGLTNGQLCYCLSRYGGALSSGCTIPCVTESNSFCGSHDSISIYSTGQKGPSPPRRLEVTKSESTSLHISWQPPNIPNGNVTSYIIRLNAVETHSHRTLQPTKSQVQGASSTMTTLTNLHPGSKYNISITALNAEGESDSIFILEWTSIGLPKKPETPKIIDRDATTITVILTKGSSENGPLTDYQILVIYPGTIPPIDHTVSFPNYDKAINDSFPYYVTTEFEAAEFDKYKKFVVGNGIRHNGFYNAPLQKPFENPQIGLVAVSRTRNAAQYSYSDLTSNPLLTSTISTNGTTAALYIAIIFLGLVLTVTILIFLVLKKRHAQARLQKLPEQQELTLQGPIHEIDNMAYTPEDVPEIPNYYQDLKKKVWNIPKKLLTIQSDVLKRGRFGPIYRGTVQDSNEIFSNVIIHSISDISLKPSEKKHMLRDLGICIRAGTMKYLAGFVGNCETSNTLYIVFEATADNLKNRLLSSRSGCAFPYDQILPIGSMIAQGLDYLQAHKIIHNRLCARSIGLTTNFIPKIMGYGIEKYAMEDVKLARWTAPESFGHKKHQPAVSWAFGVVIWEMMALGGTPYHDLEDESDVEEAVVENDVRLPQLREIPDPLYEVLQSCWAVDPTCRPMFDELSRLNTLSICPITAITEPYHGELELN